MDSNTHNSQTDCCISTQSNITTSHAPGKHSKCAHSVPSWLSISRSLHSAWIVIQFILTVSLSYIIPFRRSLRISLVWMPGRPAVTTDKRLTTQHPWAVIVAFVCKDFTSQKNKHGRKTLTKSTVSAITKLNNLQTSTMTRRKRWHHCNIHELTSSMSGQSC